MRQPARAALQQGFRQFLRRRIAENRGVDIGNPRQLRGNRRIHPRISMPQTRHRRPAGAIDNAPPIGRVQINSLAPNRQWRVRKQSTVQQAAHWRLLTRRLCDGAFLTHPPPNGSKPTLSGKTACEGVCPEG